MHNTIVERYDVRVPQPLNIRNVDDATMVRLAEQAAVEGVTVSEWIRQILDRAAVMLSPGELATKRHSIAAHAMAPDEFAAYYDARLHRRPFERRPKAG